MKILVRIWNKRILNFIENKNDQLELEIKLLKDKINNLNQSQRMNNYSNENLNTIEQVFPKPEKLNNKAKFTFIDTYEDNNDNIINANKWENEEIEINEEIDNFNEKNTSNEINTWNKVIKIITIAKGIKYRRRNRWIQKLYKTR